MSLAPGGNLHDVVKIHRAAGLLTVQPRMGFAQLEHMRSGLEAVKKLPCATVGTITLDSYTRVGDYQSAHTCLREGHALNGFPLLSHPVDAVKGMLEGLYTAAFPIQVRHGTAQPQNVFRRLTEVGINTTEGGPVSYCMPYSRLPLKQSITAWSEGSRLFCDGVQNAHIESFGGCLLGQLCPPSMLVAMVLLEGLFFQQHGVPSLSLSYTQGTLVFQDLGALRVLRGLATRYLRGCDWHVVIYTYMGVFPTTEQGAKRLISDSARLAWASGSERLIVKTIKESRHLPTVEDNLEALLLAASVVRTKSPTERATVKDYADEIEFEATLLIEQVLNLSSDIGRALNLAFLKGLLDIPYCLHPDNARQVTTLIDREGALRWRNIAGLPFPTSQGSMSRAEPSAAQLLKELYYVANQYDQTWRPCGNVLA